VTLTYVYCLVRSARRPQVRDAAAGVPGSLDLRALSAGGGLWMIASTVPATEYDEAALARGLQDLDWVSRRALAHEHIVEQFMTARAVLPMQMFRLFRSDDRALAHIASGRRMIDRALAQVEGQFEFGLRLTLDEKAARQAGARQVRGGAGAAGSGTDYLAQKRDLMRVDRAALASARREANRLYRAMSREASRARRRTETEQASAGSRLLLDAVFLVPSRRAAAFRSSLRTHARTLAAGLVISLTGPWPPYNFVGTPRRTQISS